MRTTVGYTHANKVAALPTAVCVLRAQACCCRTTNGAPLAMSDIVGTAAAALAINQTALLLAMDSSDSDSDDGSYVANEESESDDEIEEPAAPERARSAAELIAALEDAPDEEIRAMMREARPLRRGPLDELPGDLRNAFVRRISDLQAWSGNRGTIAVFSLCELLVCVREEGFAVFDILCLDEHVVLVSVLAGVVTLYAYDRHVLEASMERHGRLTLGTAERVELNPDIVPVIEEQLFTSTQDQFREEKALSYARYFEPDDNGCWQVPWLPLADGSFRHDRAEQLVTSAVSLLYGQEEQEHLMRAMESVFSGDMSVLFRLKALENLYTTDIQEHGPFRLHANAVSPPGALRRGRNWARRKHLVLLRALESRGPRRATTRTPLARFLCRICPEPQFRDIIGRL